MSDAEMTEQIAGRAAAAWGVPSVAVVGTGTGGYTSAARLRVRTPDGRSAFVKAGTSDQTARWLRDEWRVYGSVHAPFLPEVYGWDDDGALPLLVLEDLANADWPPPWSPERVRRVRATLAEVAATPPPAALPALDDQRADFAGWATVANDPTPFLSTGVCSRAWLDAALPTLLRADETAPLSGDALLHFDVRSDNLCFAGERTLLVDWNWACRGNPVMDVLGWLPSLRMEGGPVPSTVLPAAETAGVAEMAALMAGFFGAQAGLPDPTGPEGRLRTLQRAQLRVDLPWAAACLSLPTPDGDVDADAYAR